MYIQHKALDPRGIIWDDYPGVQQFVSLNHYNMALGAGHQFIHTSRWW